MEVQQVPAVHPRAVVSGSPGSAQGPERGVRRTDHLEWIHFRRRLTDEESGGADTILRLR